MNKKFPVNICPETTVCWDMGDVHVMSVSDAVCGFRAFQHNLKLYYNDSSYFNILTKYKYKF
jgi:hypothetical protein